MKKALVISTLVGAMAMGEAAHAEMLEAKQGGVFFGSAIAGASLGGPVGAVVGALTGVWLSESLEDADKVDDLETRIAANEQEKARLKMRLVDAETATLKYAQAALDQLQLALMFKTNDSELSAVDQRRLELLAEFVANDPQLHVRLDGHADPRGKKDENEKLARERVDTVANLLVDNGLEEIRISRFSHGETQSTANKDDMDAYAMERVVNIQLERRDQSVAGNNH